MNQLTTLVCEEMGYSPSDKLGPEDISVMLMLLQDLYPINTFHQSLSSIKTMYPDIIDWDLLSRDNVLQSFLDRVSSIQQERVTLKSPCLRVNPIPQFAYTEPVFAIIFNSSATLIQDTIHQMQNDSWKSCNEGTPIRIMGIHKDWLDFSTNTPSTHRGLSIDNKGLIVEETFKEPVFIKCAFITHLDIDTEQRVHRELTMAFHNSAVKIVNPEFESSKSPDSKSWCHSTWKPNIPTPECMYFDKSNPISEIFIRNFLNTNRLNDDFIAQPDRMTEGIDIQTSRRNEQTASSITKFICEGLEKNNAMIVRHRRGNFYFKKENIFYPFVLRVNVFSKDGCYEAKSGFGLISSTPDNWICSRSHGSDIISPCELFSSLAFNIEGQFHSYPISQSDIDTITQTAVLALKTINNARSFELGASGVDIVIEHDTSNKVVPVVIEINSRPSGLAHSRLISLYKNDLYISSLIYEYFRG